MRARHTRDTRNVLAEGTWLDSEDMWPRRHGRALAYHDMGGIQLTRVKVGLPDSIFSCPATASLPFPVGYSEREKRYIMESWKVEGFVFLKDGALHFRRDGDFDFKAELKKRGHL